jgi:hypothetical protein
MTHARLGRFAVWTCKGCTVNQFTGRLPCTDCCGYTTSAEKVVRGVLTLKGRPNARCLP